RNVSSEEGYLVVEGRKVRVLSEKEPGQLPWRDLNIDVVIESTGRFATEEELKIHLTAGAKKVVLSAPLKSGSAPTVVLGVNNEAIKGQAVIANASCTTNCVAPVAQVIQNAFGIEKAMLTTTHSVTSEQNLVDGPPPGLKSGDLRRARAAYTNIIPTSTGATEAAAKAIPELEGIFSGVALRVPTAVVSLSDFTFILKKEVTADEVNNVFRQAAKEPRWQGILGVTDEQLVSSDFKGSSYSAVVDLPLTQVVGGNMVKVFAWYDNEWGYSNRLVEEVILVGS
ncbi:MAG TPA: glyceraldehyde 3-phosphate dehydrogenase NAD-binding domain-containing protein, partial [Patescibacteria group bacterium]|nr:glyceraldehyde 3-phosphate dehydrogenase NAD-binding domain-containing protein [Patescibacteria group bacterium]